MNTPCFFLENEEILSEGMKNLKCHYKEKRFCKHLDSCLVSLFLSLVLAALHALTGS